MWIYERTNDNLFRFILGRDGKNPLVCFGVNPSTAVPDGTVIKGRVEQLGFDWIDFSEKLLLNDLADQITDTEIRLKDDFKSNMARISEVFGKSDLPPLVEPPVV